jgi:dihydrofolate reductase
LIAGIVAVERNQGIGFEGQMPWPHLKGDMKSFVSLTAGNIVVMGSATWRGLGKQLPNRINVVISSTLQTDAHLTFTDPVEAITDLQERYAGKDIFIIGGQKLYDSVKELISVYFVTEIDASYTCDKFFDLKYVVDSYPIATELNFIEATDTTPSYTITEYSK